MYNVIQAIRRIRKPRLLLRIWDLLRRIIPVRVDKPREDDTPPAVA